ncbi:hypothetical protein [Microtetraspora niveoalba]|uniref:hypothetical protein n=1 Tax=Microtetraspora niveoalba TaxID=46175 RepID=UPI000836F6A3|nr:hypothetical protein [Microtetraspora niveoalba]
MKRTALGLAAAAIAGLSLAVPATIGAAPASAATPDPGPETCLQGYVWRVARPSDLVCVTPEVRTRTAEENRTKAARWTDGAYGPHTCVTGFVWREAFTGDDVCVAPEVRTQTLADNKSSSDRKVLARLWVSKYTPNGPGTLPRIQVNGDHYNVGTVRIVFRYNNGQTYRTGYVKAAANAGFAGGSFGKKLDLLYCSGKPNGYVQAYDLKSGRWSPRLAVTVGCATL